jgi:NADPH2:quinone reductase
MTLAKTMTAIAIERAPSGAKLVPAEIAVPKPGAGQILIKVKSAGVNRADLLQVLGHHPPPAGAPDTPGLEAAGTIVEIGPGL